MFGVAVTRLTETDSLTALADVWEFTLNTGTIDASTSAIAMLTDHFTTDVIKCTARAWTHGL